MKYSYFHELNLTFDFSYPDIEFAESVDALLVFCKDLNVVSCTLRHYHKLRSEFFFRATRKMSEPTTPQPVASDDVVEEDVLRDSEARYLAYAQRVARVLGTSSRYLAFSSDVGEAFRPVVSSQVVRFSYLMTWGYVFSDIGYSTYSAYKLHPDNANFAKDRAARATAFQLFGSVIFPFVIIHTGVKQTSNIINKVAPNMKFIRTWGPSAVGLAIIPLLPRFVDHPTENAVDNLFKTYNPFNLEAKFLDMHHHKHE